MNWIKNFFKTFFDRNKKLRLEVEARTLTITEKGNNFPEFPVVQSIAFESDIIEGISSSEVLDTTDPLNVAKYKNNLRLLVEQARQMGKVDKFMLIRNDDFFPLDWQWRVGSKDTGVEKVGSNLTYELRKSIARRNAGITPNAQTFSDIVIPMDDFHEDKINEQLSLIPLDVGRIYQPVHFRSTKHFTVNTPLSYTGEYNCVDDNRLFTIMDPIDNFLNSEYGYAAAYRDAYLDVTHESLPISDQAIVFIAENNYDKVMQDPNIAKQLKERRVIVYRGEIAVAVNMVLSEQGILPSRPGNRYFEYDDDIRNILENSMMSLCQDNNLAYNKGHGNIDGKGGHFSDLYDGMNQEHLSFQNDFINFLKEIMPEYRDVLSPIILRDSSAAYKAIQVIGIDRLLQAIEVYNQRASKSFSDRLEVYKNNRLTITPDISAIFKMTVKAIDNYYNSHSPYEVSLEEQNLIRVFYHSPNVEEQLLAATTLCQKWGIQIEQNDYQSSFNI